MNAYIRANLIDSLEFLLSKNIFYRLYKWRCSYCGHNNMKNFNNLKDSNNCEICNKTKFTPIGLEWEYMLNDFVYQSLCERNGLTVLWALGDLQDRPMNHSFYYLPEVDLFSKIDSTENKGEIDILCVLDGKFYAAEVKLTVISFVQDADEVEKYIEKINLIRPDVALLIFEYYCDSESEVTATKERLEEVREKIIGQLRKNIALEIVVAIDLQRYIEPPMDFGYQGERVHRFYESLEMNI